MLVPENYLKNFLMMTVTLHFVTNWELIYILLTVTKLQFYFLECYLVNVL